MKQNLLKEMETGSKNALLKKRIITHYIYNGSSTITDLIISMMKKIIRRILTAILTEKKTAGIVFQKKIGK